MDVTLQNLSQAVTYVWYCFRVPLSHESRIMFRGSPSTPWATKEALTQDSHEGEVWGTRGELPLVGMGVWGLILASWFPMVEISATAGGVDTRTGLANKGLPVLLLYCLLECTVKLCLWDWKEESSIWAYTLTSLVWKHQWLLHQDLVSRQQTYWDTL